MASRLIWEEKCRARWPSPLPIFPAPTRYFSIPLSSPIFLFLAVSTRVELPPGREVSNDLTEHSRFRSPNSHMGLYRRCLPVAYPFFLWRSDAVFLPSRSKKNSSRHRGTWQRDSGFKRLTRFRSRRMSNLCKMKLCLSITAECERHSL